MRALLLALWLTAFGALSFDTLFADWNSEDTPGVAVVVVDDGRVTHAYYGMADIANARPITGSTRFDLASVSKQFTAMAVMILADEGKLAVDDPVAEHLPGFPYQDVTIRDLLRMQSGLPDYQDASLVSLEDLFADLKAQKRSFKVGNKYEYLNMNYALLTYVVEEASGQKLGDFMQARIFRPLGMKSTVFFARAGQKIPDRAIGYKEAEKSVWDCPGIGDGNVYSTAPDLALWAQELLHGAPRLVKPATLKAAWTSGLLPNGTRTNYGFGWTINQHLGRRLIWHDGSWYGASTYLGLYPDDGVAVILLSNDEDFEGETLGKRIAKMLLE